MDLLVCAAVACASEGSAAIDRVAARCLSMSRDAVVRWDVAVGFVFVCDAGWSDLLYGGIRDAFVFYASAVTSASR
ncbi:hypothetical protein CA603_39525 [Paraburkholderia hospita]|nr:hypothetical protein CA603_39525 [Paraburkholderia hospita]